MERLRRKRGVSWRKDENKNKKNAHSERMPSQSGGFPSMKREWFPWERERKRENHQRSRKREGREGIPCVRADRCVWQRTHSGQEDDHKYGRTTAELPTARRHQDYIADSSFCRFRIRWRRDICGRLERFPCLVLPSHWVSDPARHYDKYSIWCQHEKKCYFQMRIQVKWHASPHFHILRNGCLRDFQTKIQA